MENFINSLSSDLYSINERPSYLVNQIHVCVF